jgi:hypothetical protein
MGILPPKFKATQSVFLSWLLILATFSTFHAQIGVLTE